MVRWNNYGWTALGGSALLSGAQLAVTPRALAHAGHHGKAAEPETPGATGKHPMPSSVADPSQSPPQPDPDAMATPAGEMPMNMTDEPPMQATPVVQESLSPLASQSGLSEGFSLGWGESLLGLLIAGPFLLLSVKKQLQS